MELRELGVLREDMFSTVRVCEGEDGERYTVWDMKQQEAARKLMQMEGGFFYSRCVQKGEHMWILFPYEEPRPLFRFYKGALENWEERKRIYENLIKACREQKLPFPVLYLLLAEKSLNLKADGSVSFCYNVSLKRLDGERREDDCVQACVSLILELMQQGGKEEKACYALLHKKRRRNIYRKFDEVIEDLNLIDGRKRLRPFVRMKRPEQTAVDRIFRRIFVLAAVLAVAALVLFVSQVLFGDLPLFRIFSFSFILEK